jgi:hypothetical protein
MWTPTNIRVKPAQIDLNCLVVVCSVSDILPFLDCEVAKSATHFADLHTSLNAAGIIPRFPSSGFQCSGATHVLLH